MLPPGSPRRRLPPWGRAGACGLSSAGVTSALGARLGAHSSPTARAAVPAQRAPGPPEGPCLRLTPLAPSLRGAGRWGSQTGQGRLVPRHRSQEKAGEACRVRRLMRTGFSEIGSQAASLSLSAGGRGPLGWPCPPQPPGLRLRAAEAWLRQGSGLDAGLALASSFQGPPSQGHCRLCASCEGVFSVPCSAGPPREEATGRLRL